MTHSGPRYLLDLAERTAATYFEALLGLLLASGFGVAQITDLSFWTKAAVAAIPAALAVLKSGLARFVGSPNTAALLPAEADTPQPGIPPAGGAF